jgi:hypothetical protein
MNNFFNLEIFKMSYRFIFIIILSFLLFSQKVLAQVTVTATAGTVGPTVYTNLRLAFAQINNGTHQGAITVTVTASFTDNNVSLLTASGVTGANYTSVNILPDANGRIITSNANPMINFNGADNVTIDGGNAGAITGTNRLMFRQTANNVTVQFINDATNYTVKEAIFESNSTSTSGTFFFTTGVATGNDDITVQNCVIRNRTDSAPTIAAPAGTTNVPRTAVNSTGSSLALQNDNITFDACEFINFFSTSNNTTNILIGNNTKAFTLKNSHIYQTVNFFGSNSFTTYSQLVQVNGTNTDNIVIEGNFFGGRAVNCGGTAFVYSNPNGNRVRLRVVQSGMATGTTLTIQNNTVSNFQTDFQGTNTGGADAWLAFNGAGKMIIKDNTISNLRFSQTTNGGTPANASVQVINYAGDGTGEITNNSISDIQLSFTMTPTHGFSFDALRIDPANAGLVVSQNTIGSTSTINSILCNASTALNAINGINVVSTSNNRSCTIHNNIVANITHDGTSTSILSGLVGIKATSISNLTLTENSINNLSSNLQIPSAGTVVAVAGMNLSSNANYVISRNKIHTIICSAIAGTGANACGILLDGGISGTLDKQAIYNIRNTSGGATPAAAGIISRNVGSSMFMINNMISLGLNIDGSSNTEDAMYLGVWNNFSDGDKLTFVYNSVAISGNITNGTKNSYGFLRGDNAGTSITTPVEVINNLFYNERQELGTGSKHFALGNQVTCTGWGGGAGCMGIAPPCIPSSGGNFLPNYNALYSPLTMTTGEWLGTEMDLATFQTTTLADDKSIYLAGKMVFTNLPTADLHVANSEFRINASALPLTTITLTDYDGDFRRGPDRGADEVENMVTFSGATDDWNLATNWTPAIVPTCADIAIIPNGKNVIIYGGTTAQCYKLQIKNGGSLTMQNNTAILEQCWLKGTTIAAAPYAISGAVTHDGFIDVETGALLTMNTGFVKVAGEFDHSGTFDKGTSSTVELNLDRASGNTCFSDFIFAYNSTVAISDIGGTAHTNFHHLTILNNGNTTILGVKNVIVGDATTDLGNLDINGSGWLAINGNTLTIEGDLASDATNTGSIAGSITSDFVINGRDNLTGTIKLRANDGQDNQFRNFRVNRSNKGTMTFNEVTNSLTSVIVNTQVQLDEGIIRMGIANPLTNILLDVTNNSPNPTTGAIINYLISGGSTGKSWVHGRIRRAINGTVGNNYSYPVGDATRYELMRMDISTAIDATQITGYFDENTATGTPSLMEAGYTYSAVCLNGFWNLTPNTFSVGVYDIEIFPVGIICGGARPTFAKSPDGAGTWSFEGSAYVNAGKRTGFTAFSDFSFINTVTLLPIELISFNAHAQENSALITWETVWEKENDYFEVEKSIDGKNFFSIGKLSGRGTSNQKTIYKLLDNEPSKGINYYRLKQVDFDGKTNYSKIVSLYFEAVADIFAVFPNPSNGADINILLSANTNNELNISVIDALGRSVFTDAQLYQGVKIQLKTNKEMAQGIYLVVVQNLTTGKTYQKKLIVK